MVPPPTGLPGGLGPRECAGQGLRARTSHNNDDDDPFEGSFWKPLGPSSIPDGQTDATKSPVLSPVSGRVSAIAVHPWNPNIVYVGGAQGGVWVTYNARSSKPHWFPLTDHEASLAVGSIAIDPKDPSIIYVGTGEPNFSCDSYYGRGILRSTNGGISWKLLGGGGEPFDNTGPFVGKSVSKILIDPVHRGLEEPHHAVGLDLRRRLHERHQRRLQREPGPAGVWRSRDSGTTWEQVFSGFVNDMALDPTDHEVALRRPVRQRRLQVDERVQRGPHQVHELDRVAHRERGRAPWDASALSIGGPAAHGMLYAAIANDASSGLWGLFKTTDGGATWANVDDGFRGGATVENFDFGPGSAPWAWFSGAAVRISSPTAAGAAAASTWAPSPGRSSSWMTRIRCFLTATFPGIGAPADLPYSVANYPNYCDGQCWYDMTVAVDPTDPSGGRVYVGGNPHLSHRTSRPTWRSPSVTPQRGPARATTTGAPTTAATPGASISQGDGLKGGLHTDDHAIAFDGWGTVYDGNDGGIWRSRDRGSVLDVAEHQPGDHAVPGRLHPSQERGASCSEAPRTTARTSAMPPSWLRPSGSTRTSATAASRSSTIRLRRPCITPTSTSRSSSWARPETNGGEGGPGSWPFVGSYYYPGYYNGMDPTDPVSFYAPLAQHPAFTPNVVYFGSDKVYRSADPRPPCCDGAANFECFLERHPRLHEHRLLGRGEPVAHGAPAFYVSWIGVFPKLIAGKEVLYTGSADGRIAVSAQVDGTGVAIWNVIDGAPLPDRAVASIEVPGTDPTGNTAYVKLLGVQRTRRDAGPRFPDQRRALVRTPLDGHLG